MKPISWTYSASLRGQLAIGQPAIAFLGDPHPGAEMDLVDRDGRSRARVPCGGRTSNPDRPIGIATGPRPSRRSRAASRRGSRRGRPSRSRWPPPRGVIAYLYLRPARHRGRSAPRCRVAPAVHRVGFGIPVVEVADDRDRLGVRRPDGEVGAERPVQLDDVGARASRTTGSASPRRAGGGRNR